MHDNQKCKYQLSRKGFTLVELLLVIGIIATLAVVAFVALDPAKRFQDARNAKRLSDIENISSAVVQYVIDNKGAFPPGLDATEKQIATSMDTCAIETGGCSVTGNDTDCIDLSASLIKYFNTVPFEASNGIGPDHSHYSIIKNENNIVTVRACDAEGEEIYISR